MNFDISFNHKLLKSRRAIEYKSSGLLASVLGCTRQTLDNWENGKFCPSLLDAYKLGKILNIDIKDLVIDESKQERID